MLRAGVCRAGLIVLRAGAHAGIHRIHYGDHSLWWYSLWQYLSSWFVVAVVQHRGSWWQSFIVVAFIMVALYNGGLSWCCHGRPLHLACCCDSYHQ